jgi:hypothetical protein
MSRELNSWVISADHFEQCSAQEVERSIGDQLEVVEGGISGTRLEHPACKHSPWPPALIVHF